MSFLVLPQHEQFYPEHLSVFAAFPLGWIKLAPKFKGFPARTAIFKDLNFYSISKFKDFQGLSRCVRTPTLLVAEQSRAAVQHAAHDRTKGFTHFIL